MPNVLLPGRPPATEPLSRPFASAEDAAQAICRVLRDALDVDLAQATRVVGQKLEIVAAHGRDGAQPAGRRLELEHTLCGRALQGAPPVSSDVAVGPYASLPPEILDGVTTYAMQPVPDGAGSVAGTLCVFDSRPREFSAGEMELLELLGSLLSREQELDGARAREAARTAELEASSRRYHALVDDLGDIIVEIGADGRVRYVNPAWVALTGIGVDEMAGKDMMEHVHPDDHAVAASHLAEALQHGGTVSAAREVRFYAADGAVRWMSVRGRAVFDDDGGFAGFLGILHDVTVRVEAEERVRAALAQAEEARTEAEAARDQAERASAAKTEFLSRMSHELRTPLNAILGFGQLLELAELGGEDAENIEQIMRAGRHLLDLINEVLDVVRIEAGVLQLDIEPVEVGDVAAESLDLVRPAAAARGITLRTPQRSDGATVVADRQRLKQVLVNLLSNAVKYNRDGGEVVLGWRSVTDHEADGLEPGEHGWLAVSVSDTGCGIPADRLEDAFRPFDRLGQEATGIEGSGVGLSVARTLVEALGGRIGVTSTVGEGSTFRVDLPAAAPADPPPAAVPAEPVAVRTVLYVEDNPSNITLVRRVLARRPHVRMEVVHDGLEAVDAAGRLLPDLVLLDLHLPGLNGEEVLARLRAAEDPRLRSVPVVVVTADLTAGTERRILAAGATRFLPKPIDVHELLAVVDEHVKDDGRG